MMRTQRVLAAVVLTLGALPAAGAQAQSAEDRYLAARDRAVARFKNSKLDQPTQEAEKRAREELEPQMRSVIGSLRPDGFDAGQLNLGSLFEGDGDFGRLDGLRFEADRRETEMVVTTPSLLARWLREEAKIWKDPKLRQPETAFRSELFFTRAINTDAAVVRFAEIPLDAGNSAYALLGSRTQDQTPYEAAEVFVAALKGGHAFVAGTTLQPPLAIAACGKPRVEAEKKLNGMVSDAQRTGKSGKPALDFNKMSDAIAAEFLRCFRARAPQEARFAEAVRAAQALYARMPEK